MLINSNLPLQNTGGNARPSPERLGHSPAGGEADSAPASTLTGASDQTDQSLSVISTDPSEDTQPLEDAAAADAAMNYAKSNIVMQPATALLAQANTLPQN